MASAILGAVGSIFGPLGTIIGTAVGSFVDQAIIGALQDPIKGPTLDDLTFNGYDEGNPCPFVLGQTGIRVSGQLIWASEIREVTEEEGGKGGGGPKTEVTTYFVDLAVAFARTVTEGPEPVRKIWLAGELIMDLDVDVNISAGDITIAKKTTKKTIGTDPSCSNIADEERIIYTHEDSTKVVYNFFKDVRSGFDVTITGADDSVNNGTFRVVSVETNVDGVGGKSRIEVRRCTHVYEQNDDDTCTEIGTCDQGANDGPGPTITFVQDLPDFNSAAFDSITQYTGDITQLPDPTIEAAEGTGKVNAFRGTTYVVLKNLDVTKFGANIPTPTGVVREATSRTVGEALVILGKRSEKLADVDFDVSGVTGTVSGFAVVGPIPPAEAMKQLMAIFGIEVQEQATIDSEGVFRVKLRFFDRENVDTFTIPDAERGAAPVGQRPPDDPVVVEDVDPSSLPQSLTVRYQDIENDYQKGSRTYHGEANPIANDVGLNLPYALTPNAAETLAKISYWQLYINERRKSRVDLPPSNAAIAEGDLLDFNDSAGNPRFGKVKKIDRGVNGLVKCDLLIEQTLVYTLTAFGSPGGGGGAGLALPPELSCYAEELPNLVNGDGVSLGIQIATSLLTQSGQFPGAQFVESVDGGTNFTNLKFFFGQAVTGLTSGKLSGGVSGRFIDRVNTLTVELDSSFADLLSSNIQDVAGGAANQLMVGNEIIGYVNATKIANRTYQLDTLFRGRRNTEVWIDNHADNERVLLLTGANVFFVSLGLDAFQSTRLYRSIPSGSAVDDADNEKGLGIQGNSVRPFGPNVHSAIRRDNGDIIISWRRRSRAYFRLLGGVVGPMLELQEVYEIDILSGAGLVLRTLVIEGKKEANYRATAQVADFGSTQSSVDIRIYQISDSVGRGFLTEATV